MTLTSFTFMSACGFAITIWYRSPPLRVQRTYAQVMRRELGRAGDWLVGTGIGIGCCGYLIATVAAGGTHPVWPYFLFGAMAASGFCLRLAGHRDERATADEAMRPSGFRIWAGVCGRSRLDAV